MIVSMTSIGPIGQDLRRNGIRVEALGITGLGSALGGFLALRKLLRDFAPHIVQTWMYHADLFGGLVARSLGINRVVWGIRNSVVPADTVRQRTISWCTAKMSWWMPRAIICVAEASVRPYAEAGYDTSKMTVVSNGLDFEPFDRILVRDHTPLSQPHTILCVGRYHLDKGQDLLLEAAAILLRERDDLSFVFAGRGCSLDNPPFRQLVDDHGLADHVVALGERTDIPELLASARIFCMPSRTEGFPNGLAEAMAMNKPCIATDVGDAAKLMGGTGILVATPQPTQLAEALERALALSTQELDAMGQKAGERVRGQFSIQVASMHYLELYRQVIEGTLKCAA